MRFFRRLAHWMRFRANSADLAEELAFHREAIERDLIAQGHSQQEAHAAAHRQMGQEMEMREASRHVWLWPSLEAIWMDAKVTLRGLRRSPEFTVGVMLTFALGVGANAAMFSLIDRMMFRTPSLMRDPASVNRAYLYRTSNGIERETGGQYARYADIVTGTSTFAAVAGHTSKLLAVGVGQDAQEMRIGIVSANFFGFFNAIPVAGRYFTADEDTPQRPAAVAVLSYAMWKTRYSGRQEAIGSAIHIGALVYTIIGVAPEHFVGLWPLRPPAAFIPVTAYAASVGESDWATNYGTAIGMSAIVRRKPGVSVTAASADLSQALLRSFRAQYEGAGTSTEVRLQELRPRALAGSILVERGPGRSNVAKVATWLGGVTMIVLLIACANVASLFLARALSKRRELAVRLALGVSRTRLLTQVLTESMLLAVAGSVLGLVAARWIGAMLSATFFPGTEPVSIATDTRTLLFIGIVTLLIGAFTSVLPLAQAKRLTLTDDLKSGTRAGTYNRARARSMLLVVQSALSLVLLIGSGLFVRSLQNVREVRLGFDANSVLVAELNMRDVKLDSAQISALRLRLLGAAKTVPGIEHASLQMAVPFGGMAGWPFFVAGIDSVRKFGQFELNAVSPDYFATMGTRILRGRSFEEGDVDGARRVMVIGASMGRTLWPGEDPLGKCVHMILDTMPCTYVVGIAEDIQARDFGPQPRNFYYYLPAAQMRPQEGGLFARASGNGAQRSIEPLRRRLQQEMPGTSYITVARLGEFVEEESRSWVMGATIFTAFGALALVIAAVGLYSAITYNVAQRKKELAVRVALGAAGSDVMRLVVGEALRLALIGAAVGGAIALILAPQIAPLLFNQSPRDPAVFGVVTGVLLLVSVGSSVIPAIHGARVDPNRALRAE